MRRATLEERVVERTPVTAHVGKSGASLERWRLDDGTSLVVKRLRPDQDLLMTLTHDSSGREYELWAGGLLDHLPAGVSHAVVAGWTEPGGAVLAMRDLGDAVLTWEDRLDARRCSWVLQRLAELHTALSEAPTGRWRHSLLDISVLLTLFAPDRIAPYVGGASALPGLAVRGWRIFEELVAPDVSGPVAELLARPAPLVDALRRCPCTVIHGDVATVNMAISSDVLVLLDWSMCASAPGTVDLARFIAGCASVVDPSREDMIEAYAAAAGSAFHEEALRLGLLTGTLWLGWNKALDARDHPDEALRDREREDLDWWVRQARTTLRSGIL